MEVGSDSRLGRACLPSCLNQHDHKGPLAPKKPYKNLNSNLGPPIESYAVLKYHKVKILVLSV